MADIVDGIIIGAAAAAIGTIIAVKILQRGPYGGSEPFGTIRSAFPNPTGTLAVVSPEKLPSNVAPVAQNVPITEAAYNQYPYEFAPGFGPQTNVSDQEAILLQ